MDQQFEDEVQLEPTRLVALIVLEVKERVAICRLPGAQTTITLRASSIESLVPGEFAVIAPKSQWSYKGHPYLSGTIVDCFLEVPALELVPLALHDRGDCRSWRSYEMEQVIPGYDPMDYELDPIGLAVDHNDSGDRKAARKILMGLCRADLRCIDAHAHLGNLVFEVSPEIAIRHYAVGMAIGEMSLPADFDGVLEWGCIDNRPYLRCLHSYGLCLWRLGRFKQAEGVFVRMLALNPDDNRGVRFLLDPVRRGEPWMSDELLLV